MNSKMYWTIKLLVLACSVIWSTVLYGATATAQQGSDTIEKIVTQLHNESIQILGGFRSPIVRWGSDVNVAIVGDANPATVLKITNVFNDISLYTGVTYRYVNHSLTDTERYLEAVEGSPDASLGICDKNNSTLCANFMVLVATQTLMHDIALALPLRPVYQRATASEKNSHCFFAPSVSPRGEIIRSIVWVRRDLVTALLNTCVQEEIYQSFGLFGDVSNSPFFSFNNVVSPKKITIFDKQLLTSLYDAEFLPGSSILPLIQQVSDYCRINC